MSNEAEDPSKFALFPREGFEGDNGVRTDSEPHQSSEVPRGSGSIETRGRGSLVFGVLFTMIALLLSGVGHRLAPVEARVSLVTGAVLVLGYYVMNSVRIFARPNGSFLGLALAFSLVAMVPVGMSVWQGVADYAARIRVSEVADPRGAPVGVPVAQSFGQTQPAASVGEKGGLSNDASVEKASVAGGAGGGVAAPVVVPANGVAPSGSATVAAEERLSVEEREARIAAMAEISAPVVKKVNPSKGLGAGGLPGEDIPLNPAVSGGSVSGISQKEFNEKVLQSKMQVVQRYPALGRNGSDEVKIYTEVFNELVRRNRDFFLNPDWPLELAELVGKREGWIPEESGTRK